MLKNKGFSAIVFVIILAVLAGGIYWVWQEGNNKTPPPVIYTDEQVDELNEWQTYRNEEYGFEFKYPASFMSCDEKYKTQIQTSNLEGVKIFIDCYTTNINDPSIEDGQTIIWSLFVERKLFSEYPQFSSLKDYFEKQKQDAVKNLSADNEYSPYRNFEEVSISGNKYLKTGVCDMTCGLVYYVFLRNQILSVNFFHGLGDNTVLNTINNILSTFRFVK